MRVESDLRDDSQDAALVGRALDGDELAFEALLDRHSPRVLRVMRLLRVAAQDRDDLAQEAFIRVFRHLGSFQQGRSFKAWVYRIAVNVVNDHRAERARAAGRNDDAERAPEPIDDRPGASERVRDRERREALETALDELSERERAVFVFAELEELSTLEVARTLGITRITVRRHLSRARARLRELLHEHGPEKK